MASANGGSILMYMYGMTSYLVRMCNDKVAHGVKSFWKIAKFPADKLN